MTIKGPYIFVLFLMTVLFGLTFISVKFALEGLGVFQVVFGRYAIALAILTLIFHKNLGRFRIHRKDWKLFLLMTSIEPIGYFIFETFGVRYTSPSSASLMIATIPIFSLIFASFLLNERPGWLGILGIFICFGGVYFIVKLQPSTSLAPRPLLGNSLALMAAVSAGLYNCIARRLSRDYAPLTLTYYQTVAATIVFLPLAMGEYFWQNEVYINGVILGHVIYLAVGGSIFAYFLLNHALSRLGAAQVAVFSNVISVVTIIASYLIYGDVMQPLQFVGAGLVLAGIYLTYFRAGYKPMKTNIN